MPIGTKVDLLSNRNSLHQVEHGVSSVTGEGVDALRDMIAQWLCENSPARSPLLESVARCHENLKAAQQAIDRAQLIHQQSAGEDLVAMELRLALEEIGQIVGVVYTDDILDRVFSRFCIGK